MVQASHLALTSPSLLGFVRAYLWQLQRSGELPSHDEAPEQIAAKEAAVALFSSAVDRDLRNRLFVEFKDYVEQQGQVGQPSERLQTVLQKLTVVAPVQSAPTDSVIAEPPSPPVYVAQVIAEPPSPPVYVAQVVAEPPSPPVEVAQVIAEPPSHPVEVAQVVAEAPSPSVDVAQVATETPAHSSAEVTALEPSDELVVETAAEASAPAAQSGSRRRRERR